MNHIRRIEITEYHPRKIIHNYSMETISSKLIDNINDVHIIVHKSPDIYERENIHDVNSPYHVVKKGVSFNYNSNLEKKINENENEIYWAIRLKISEFKYSTLKLKPKNFTPSDLVNNKGKIENYDDFLNLFFKKDKKWWELFRNSEELKRELIDKTGHSIIPIFQIYPLMPESLVQKHNSNFSNEDLKSRANFNLLIENLSSNYLNSLYYEILNIANLLIEFKYFYFQGPYLTFEQELYNKLQEEYDSEEMSKAAFKSNYLNSGQNIAFYDFNGDNYTRGY